MIWSVTFLRSDDRSGARLLIFHGEQAIVKEAAGGELVLTFGFFLNMVKDNSKMQSQALERQENNQISGISNRRQGMGEE